MNPQVSFCENAKQIMTKNIKKTPGLQNLKPSFCDSVETVGFSSGACPRFPRNAAVGTVVSVAFSPGQGAQAQLCPKLKTYQDPICFA